MKFRKIPIIAITVLTAACAGSSGPSHYDSGLCEELAVKIERRDSLTQRNYSEMIGQSGYILNYLVERSSHLEELPADERYPAYRELLADPEYMERFSYLFTLGSALYQADASGRLDERNAEAYRGLDEYNERFAQISDRM